MGVKSHSISKNLVYLFIFLIFKPRLVCLFFRQGMDEDTKTSKNIVEEVFINNESKLDERDLIEFLHELKQSLQQTSRITNGHHHHHHSPHNNVNGGGMTTTDDNHHHENGALMTTNHNKSNMAINIDDLTNHTFTNIIGWLKRQQEKKQMCNSPSFEDINQVALFFLYL